MSTIMRTITIIDEKVELLSDPVEVCEMTFTMEFPKNRQEVENIIFGTEYKGGV